MEVFTQVNVPRSASSIWAFLVGINEHRSERIAWLRGCVNDVEAMSIFLETHLSVSHDHIRILTNQQATRARILQTFQEFLINNPAITPGDQVLFHYSGHGSRMPDPSGLEPDGYNETIVPYDSRTPGIYDIPDKTLAALLDQLAASKGPSISVILDCCHSGSGTRKIELPGMPLVRLAPVDDRTPPPDLDAKLLAIPSRRQIGPSGWELANTSHVLLAACRDREAANEYRGRNETQQEFWYGALTYFTLQQLRQMSSDTTYAELHERVLAQIIAIYQGQSPQCEGNRDRVIFGGLRIERDPFVTIRQQEGNTVILAAGLVHGLRVGTELALYPPEVRTRADTPSQPLTTAEVVSVAATTAKARLLQAPAAPLPLLAKGVITKHAYVGLRQTVALQPAQDQESRLALERVRQAILRATPDKKPSPYLEIVDHLNQAADLYILAAEGKITIYGANGELLLEFQDVSKQEMALSVLHGLECISRYYTVLTLANEDSRSQIAGRARLGLRRYVDDAQGRRAEDLPATAISPGGELTIVIDPVVEERNWYVVDVVNESPVWVYPHVFMLNSDFGIRRLYPLSGQEEALRPHGALAIGLAGNDRPLEFYLPSDWDRSRDTLKAILTAEPCDLKIIEQDPLNVLPPPRQRTMAVRTSLEELLETLLYQMGVRSLRAAPTKHEDWAATELTITTVRGPI